MNKDLLCTLIGLGVLAVIIILSLIVNNKKKKETKNNAIDFLDGLLTNIKRVMLETLSNISLSDFADKISREAFISSVLKDIYEATWEYLKDIVEKKKNKNAIDEATGILLENKKFVDSYIEKVIDNSNLEAKILEKYDDEIGTIAEESAKELEDEDKELQEEYSNDDKYIEEVNDEMLEEIDDKDEPTEEELEKLNPQTDEAAELDPENDSSVELIDDDIYYDKGGRPRSRKTGKWVKQNK